MSGIVDSITVVRTTWDGAAASGAKRATEDVYPDSLTSTGIRAEWERADDLVRRLGGVGDVYVTGSPPPVASRAGRTMATTSCVAARCFRASTTTTSRASADG